MTDDKDYLGIFSASYERAFQFDDEKKKFLDRFYEIFFTKAPEIPQLFKDAHMGAQKTMLQDSLLYMKDFFLSRKPNEYMKRIATVHSKAGKDVRPELYDLWLDSLIEAVKEYDPEFDSEVELAWRIALSPGITYMKHMYRRS